jgi:hypothetical protein
VDARRPGSVFSTTFRYSLISLVELAREARILQTRQIAARFELSPHDLSSDEAWGLGNGSRAGNQAAGSSANSGRTAARRASERY